jgi:hypothetical protein
MMFEQALKYELSTIPELQNKIFPLNVTEGTNTPYLVYESSEGERDQTLQGYDSTKEIECGINIVADSYKVLKDLEIKVLDVILSFFGRTIGTQGLYIYQLSYDAPEELYSETIRKFICSFEIRIRI